MMNFRKKMQFDFEFFSECTRKGENLTLQYKKGFYYKVWISTLPITCVVSRGMGSCCFDLPLQKGFVSHFPIPLSVRGPTCIERESFWSLSKWNHPQFINRLWPSRTAIDYFSEKGKSHNNTNLSERNKFFKQCPSMGEKRK